MKRKRKAPDPTTLRVADDVKTAAAVIAESCGWSFSRTLNALTRLGLAALHNQTQAIALNAAAIRNASAEESIRKEAQWKIRRLHRQENPRPSIMAAALSTDPPSTSKTRQPRSRSRSRERSPDGSTTHAEASTKPKVCAAQS